MADTLFNKHPIYQLSLGSGEWSDYKVRLFIFLTFAVCAGVPAVVWALIVLHRRHNSNGRISIFFINLLLANNILELLLSLYIIAMLLKDWCCPVICYELSCLWLGSVICGVHLQQMMVLESTLSLRRPFCFAHVVFPHCSIIISIIAFICFVLGEFFSVHGFLLFTLLPLLAVTVVSWIITCRAPPNKTHRSKRSKKLEYTVLAFGTCTMILYLMFITFHVFLYIWNLWMMFVSLLSLRVIIDPLLCVVVCSETITQTHTDPRTDQTSVQAEQSV